MKHFYTLALAVAFTVLGANAALPGLKTEFNRLPKPVENKVPLVKKSLSSITMGGTRSEEENTITGDYDLTIHDCYLDGDLGILVKDANIVDNFDGTITLSSSHFVFDVIAAYNQETGEITFDNMEYGKYALQSGSVYYIKFEVGYCETEDGISNLEYQPITVKYNAEEGSIYFPEEHFFSWVAYSDPEYSTMAGYFDLFDVISLTPATKIDEIQEGQWEDVGMATMMDAWVICAYGDYDPVNYPFEVILQRNIENKNVFRLLAPYHSDDFLFAEINTSRYLGQIVFDITDRKHVAFKPGLPAGFNTNLGEMYVYDLLGWQIWMYGPAYTEKDFDVIVAFMEKNRQPFSTLADDGTLTVNRSVFDLSPDCTNASTWNDAISYTSIIKLPKELISGVDNIADDTFDAPVMYYNLQGVHISNPEVGQVVIRVQGDKVTKEIVK